MKAYADTGFLCSLYTPDAHSHRASASMRKTSLPLPLVWLHQLELRNALRLRVYRGDMTRTERDVSLNTILGDIAEGVLRPTTVSQTDVTLEAERLSALYTEKGGARSLDILHVSSALVLGCALVLSFDRRQRALARQVGLGVAPQ